MSGEAEAKIRDYVTKYAEKHNITFEEAKEHVICKMIEAFYGNVKGENTDERNDIFR